MTNEELEKLAEMVARLLAEHAGGPWVPAPVRPEPPGDPMPGALPAWAGAAQTLPDVAPVRRPAGTSRHRPEYPALITAARQAAAGRGPAPLPAGSRAGSGRAATMRTARTVTIGVSKRHLHVSAGDFETLFGKGRAPTAQRPITQPGQYAAAETVTLAGPKGRIEGVRIVGPARGTTQLELSPADCRELGVTAPVRLSGHVEGSGGGVTLEGPAGKVALSEGVIVAQRHLHVAPGDAARLGLADGDVVVVECGPAGRRTTFQDVRVRLGPTHATELHLDSDEANAAKVTTGDAAIIVGVRHGVETAGKRRPLITERDVAELASRGETLASRGPYLLTPAARDRAKALGIWREES